MMTLEDTFSAKVIEDLQSRLAFQEDLISSLNSTVVEQANAIQVLQLQMVHLSQRLKSVIETVGEPGQDNLDERPPHY